MTTSHRGDPLRELAELQERLNRVFEETAGRSPARGDEPAVASWTPAVDVYETHDRLVFLVELPGLAESDVALRVDGDVLTLEGERRFSREAEGETWHRVERPHGRFYRSFALPSSRFDVERVSASLESGVLAVELPRREEARARKIQIQASPPALDVRPQGEKPGD